MIPVIDMEEIFHLYITIATPVLGFWWLAFKDLFEAWFAIMWVSP